MPPATLTPELAHAAPAVALRLAGILRALSALIAQTLLRNPRLVLLTIPLCNYISRTVARFSRLLAATAAGRLRVHPPRPGQGSGPRPLAIPRHHAWLATTLGHNGRNYASQLNHLLNEPATASLLAATPQAGRILRPLCHLLGIRPPVLFPPRPAQPRPVPAAPRHTPPPPARTTPSYFAPPHPPRPAPHQILCERLLARWPWNQLPAPTPA